MAKEQNNGHCEQAVISEMMGTLKHLKSGFKRVTQEAGTPELYTQAKKLYDKISSVQRDVYDAMVKQGWYHPTAEKAPAISKIYTKFSKKAENL